MPRRDSRLVPERKLRVGTSCIRPAIVQDERAEPIVTLPGIGDFSAEVSPPSAMLGAFRCRCTPPTPRYDKGCRELWVGDFLVLRFAREAWNLIAVLNEFESRHRPAFVESPLGGMFDRKSANQLWKAVFGLNHKQSPWLVRFRGRWFEGTIAWEHRLRREES